MMESAQNKNWFDIKWPVEGHQPHYEMSHEVFDELVHSYPNIDVEQELNNAYRYMMEKFKQCDEASFTRFITNWMDKNERVAKRKNRWFGERK